MSDLACRVLRQNNNDLLDAAAAMRRLRPDLSTEQACTMLADEFVSCELHEPKRTNG